MAATDVHVPGPALVQIAYAAAPTLGDLGYSRNGVDVTFRGYFDDVPSDLNGGELGPPLDVQYFGETADIQLQLTSYDTDKYALIQAQLAPSAQVTAVAGTPSIAGRLMFSGAHDFRICLKTMGTATVPAATEVLNFPRVVFRDAREINKGSRFSQIMVPCRAYKNASGVLYNNSIA